MLIQIILIVALLGIAFYLIRATPSARHLAVRRMLVFLAVIGGVVVILSPGLLTAVANAVGIGRGTDLLLYGFIVAFLLYVVTDFKRSTQLSRANTQLARQLTLAEARLQDEISRQGSKSDD
ncbi:DUF2304 domain-containing protein [Salinibacterium amurskyense]|uniref:DUF2304 domain-containing protein n=1 Tax=Salinibacterium amurskyense TaxID=205941 RepID=UPI00311FF5A1